MSLRVEIDWDKSGFQLGGLTPSGSLTPGASLTPGGFASDVTSRVRRSDGPVSVQYGRDQSTALAPTIAGRGSFVLDNVDRAFSPRNTSSPFYGYLKPNRPVRISRTLEGGDSALYPDTSLYPDSTLYPSGDADSTYTLFVGHTDDNPINPDVLAKNASVSLVDYLADFRGQTISTPLYKGIRTGEAIGYILDAAGWGNLRDIDAGATVIPWWWEDNTDALTALEKVLRSEGPPALLTVGADGSIVFKDRHHRLTDSASVTSQQVWSDASGPEPHMLAQGFTYNEAWSNIVNTGSIEVAVRTPSEPEQVWSSDATLTFTNGEVKNITVTSSDPFYDAITPEVDTDFTVISGSISAALTRTSGGSTTIVLTSTGASVVEGLALRANPVKVAYTTTITESDGSSITDYGPRAFPADLPWCNLYDTEAVLSTAVMLRAQPVPILECSFLVNDDIRAAQLLPRDLSDRVTVMETETSTNSDFYIENITHTLSTEVDHRVTFGVEAVPTTAPLVQFRFDTAGAGFNDGNFYTGVDNPNTMFRFDMDSSGHRFDDGNFAT